MTGLEPRAGPGSGRWAESEPCVLFRVSRRDRFPRLTAIALISKVTSVRRGFGVRADLWPSVVSRTHE